MYIQTISIEQNEQQQPTNKQTFEKQTSTN